MATFTTYSDGTPVVRSGGSNAAGFPAVTVFENTYDSTRRNLAAADVVELITIPAGTLVTDVFVQVVNGEATQTLDVGDGDDPNGWVAAADVGTTGTRVRGAGALAAGKFYATGDTIDIAVPATKAFATLKVRVVVSCVCMG